MDFCNGLADANPRERNGFKSINKDDFSCALIGVLCTYFLEKYGGIDVSLSPVRLNMLFQFRGLLFGLWNLI